MIYIANTPEQLPQTHTDTGMFRMQCIYTPQGVPVALFLTDNCEVAKFQHVKTKAYSYAFYVYVPTLALPTRAFSKDMIMQIYDFS